MSILLPGKEPIPALPQTISARSGWSIPIARVDDDLTRSLEEMRLKANEWLSWRRGLILRSASPFPYNCVGLIFASRRAYIEIDHIYDILREDGYCKLALSEAVVGDVVLYKISNEPSHVAVITAIEHIGQTLSVRVLSKWGLDPKFEHFMENVPAQLGSPAEFYTERQL